jgi:hypothetical protein
MDQRPLGHGLLDRVEDLAHVVPQFGGPDKQVRVFRHDDIRPDMEPVLFAGAVDGLDQPSPAIVDPENWATS